MSQVIAALRSVLGWIWRNKIWLGLGVVSCFTFAFLFFPFNDLTDLISAQVSAATRNTVYLELEKLRMSLFPQVGVQAEKVYIESLFFPGLKAEEITVTPSVRAALSQKPYGHVTAKGLFQGDVDARLQSGGTSERGNELTKLDITAERMNLQDIRAFARLPVMLKGRLNLETTGTLDMNLAEQPDLDLSVKVAQLEVPQSNIPLGDMGEVTLPELKLSGVEVKAKLSQGRLLIENVKIGGQPNDDLQGTVKGTLAMNLRNVAGAPSPDFGPYSIDIDVQPSPGFKERANFFLGLLASYQQGNRIRMKLSGTRFGPPPNMAPLR